MPVHGDRHIFPVLCKERESLQKYLTEKGIGTNIHYPISPHKQECYEEWVYNKQVNLWRVCGKKSCKTGY